MADEVQTGMGRTGTLLASDALEIHADVVTLAKGIAGGIPMGACLFRNNADGVFVAGDHQSTFAGNPLACAAGLVVLDTITSRGFLEQVTEKGTYICSKIKEWNFPCIKEIRGKGLMIGIQLSGKNPLRTFFLQKKFKNKSKFHSATSLRIFKCFLKNPTMS